MISGYLNNSIKNINHTLADFLNTIDTEFNESFSPEIQRAISEGTNPNQITGTSCVTNFDITKLIPQWVIAEKSDRTSAGETNVISVFDFLQKYYDWLYCDAQDGAQYSLSDNLLNLIDVQTTREEFLKRIYSVYFTSFPYDAVRSNPQITFDLQKARDFIVNIKKTLHGRKTNVEAIRYFFNSLFSISEDDILVYFPKKDILRLNGGMFANEYFQFTSATGSYEQTNSLGSGLNISRFQDNDWFHDWSYLVYLGSTQDNKNLKEAYTQSLHPAGLRLIFGKQITDYQGPGVPEETSRVCEYPMLRNYAEYSMTLSYGPLSGYYGITLYGLSGCTGCRLAGFTGPTHVLPTWTGSIVETRFFDINILSFIELCYEGITSPNENKTCDGCP
jgi:hypothetical protein